MTFKRYTYNGLWSNYIQIGDRHIDRSQSRLRCVNVLCNGVRGSEYHNFIGWGLGCLVNQYRKLIKMGTSCVAVVSRKREVLVER